MGFEDDFGDDDDVTANPVAEATDLTRVANGVHGLTNVLAFCQGKCPPEKLMELKVLYMRRKERRCTLVEFLQGARAALGADLLLRAVVSTRINAEQVSRARMHVDLHPLSGASTKAALNPPAGLALDGRPAPTPSQTKKTAAAAGAKGVVNLDVTQEADDVLAIAGVNPDDEAQYLYGSQIDRRRLDAGFSHGANVRHHDKEGWRKDIETAIFARIAGKHGLASLNGISQVRTQESNFLEEALQVRLKGFIAALGLSAARRNDANKDAFKRTQSTPEPKQQIRRINVTLEQEKGERVEKERQALLRVGQSILNKRKRDFEENSFLKDKVAKVRQEEDERIRATVANQAARDALGDAKYLKWYDMAKQPNNILGGKPRSTGDDRMTDAKPLESDTKANKGNAFEKLRASAAAAGSGAKTIILRDCMEALTDDDHGRRLLSLYRR